MSQPVALMLRRVLRGRWFMLYGSFLIMSAAGASSVFAVYSRGIKQALGYSQEQLNTVGFFMNLGANVGIHAGLVAGAAPPWLVLSVGAAMSLGGYLMLYLSVVAGTSSRPTLWLVCLYIVAGANAQTFPHTAALVACVSSFAPQSRGAMLGLLKGFLGLSSAIYSQLYLAFSGGGGDTRPLILLVGCLPAAISVAFLGTIRTIPAAAAAASRQPAVALARREVRAFRSFLYLSLALATYLVVAIVLQRRFRLTSAEYRLSGGAVLVMLLVFPLVVVHREEAAAATLIDDTSESEITTATDNGRQAAPSCAVNVAATSGPSPPPSQATTSEKKRANAVVRLLRRLGRRPTGPPPRGHDHTVLEALTSVDMLLLLTSTAIGVGGMLTATYNVGQIGESQGYPPGNTATFVSLISIWSYLGRVASGFASDAVLAARRRLPTPLLLSAALLLAVPGHLLIAFGVPGALYPASIIIGFCNGATQPLTLAITSELFGLKYYSTLCTFGPAVYPIGTYVFNVRVAGRMYDREAARQGAAAGHAVATTCVGVRCYRESFEIVAAAAAAAAVMALALAWRTREFYAEDISMKFGGAMGMGEQTGMDVISENGVVEEAGEKEHVSSTTVEVGASILAPGGSDACHAARTSGPSY